MKFEQSYSVQEIAQLIDAKIIGKSDNLITGINEIHKVDVGDITFVDFHKYYKKALTSEATVIIIDQEMECPTGKALLVSDNPFRDYNFLAKRFRPNRFNIEATRIKNYYVAPTAKIAEDVVIMPGAYIGDAVVVGKGSILYPNVVLNNHVELGERVIIHANTTIGADAFYYKKREQETPSYYEKMHTIGRVIIENDVEIGAGCTIDRGVSGITRIGAGTKIDNQVMIAHGVVIGKKLLDCRPSRDSW